MLFTSMQGIAKLWRLWIVSFVFATLWTGREWGQMNWKGGICEHLLVIFQSPCGKLCPFGNHVITLPRATMELPFGLNKQKFVLCQVIPPRGVCATCTQGDINCGRGRLWKGEDNVTCFGCFMGANNYMKLAISDSWERCWRRGDDLAIHWRSTPPNWDSRLRRNHQACFFRPLLTNMLILWSWRNSHMSARELCC